MTMQRLTTIFVSFLKIGMFTFGGGYAMLPLIERELITKRKWIDQKEFLDLLTLAQSPGFSRRRGARRWRRSFRAGSASGAPWPNQSPATISPRTRPRAGSTSRMRPPSGPCCPKW